MPSGSANAQQLLQIIKKAEQAAVIRGDAPGSFSVSQPVALAAAAPQMVALSAPLSVGESALVQNAVRRANAVAPGAAAAPDVKVIVGTIDAVAKGLTNVAKTPEDVKALVAGAVATLQWWGWTLNLNESATQALVSLLGNDLAGLTAIATALASAVPPMAAITAIVSAVAIGLSGWIAAEDAAKKGVTIHGYLWIGIWVQPA